VAQSGSPTQDGQDEKAGGGQEMAVMVGLCQKEFYNNNSGQFVSSSQLH